MVGKEIKVVLSLDDAGFSVKTKAARDVVKNLEVGLGGLTKANAQTEASITDLTKHLKGFTDSFGGMQKTLQATVDSLQSSVKNSFAQMGKDAQEATKVAKESATAQIDSRIKALNNELDTNKKLLESRGKMHAELRKLESDERAKATAAMLNAEKAERGKQAGAPGVISTNLAEADRLERNANAIRKEIEATSAWIAIERQAQAARLSEIASLEAERKATLEAAAAKETLARISAAVGKSNAAEIQRVTKAATEAQKDADQAAAKSAQDLARLKKQYADQEVRDRREAEAAIRRETAETAARQKREAREAAAEQKRQANEVAQMWRGMAAAYTGAKIEKGLGTSVDQADQLERQKVIVSALNLAPDEERGLIASSEAMAKNLKFVNTLEAIQSRMSAIASIGHNDADIIDKTLTTAVKAANNLQMLGMSHGDMQSTIRNLYGVVEMRQQVKDPDATNNTFETMQKIITGTAGKVQTQDMETVLRRLGIGASQLSDKGLVNLAAVVDQFKVAGGDGGGAGGGVSTVGTAFKMMQSYALGKGLSNTAVKEFAGAGVLADSGIDLSKDNAGILRDAKHGGFKDADLWLQDPVAAVQKIMPQIIEYTQSDKQRGKYYQGRDMGSAENQMVAVSMYLARLGITTTAAQAMMVAGDPRSKDRIGHQADTIQNSKGVNAVNDDLAKTYAANVKEVKTELTEIAQIVGTTLLPPLKEFLSWIKQILLAAQEFGRNNPLVTQISAIAAGFGGAVLSVRGFMMLFGSTGLGGLLNAFLGTASKIGPALAAPVLKGGGGWAGVTSLFKELFEWAGSLIARIPLVGTAITKLGSSIGTAGGFLRAFGSLFKALGMVLFAWDIGQIIGTWLNGVKVGTLTIGDYVGNLITKIEVGWKRLMLSSEENALKLRNFFRIDNDEETKKGLAGVQIRREFLNSYEKIMTVTPTDRDGQDKAAADKEAKAKKARADAEKALAAAAGGTTTNNPDANQRIVDAANGAGKREDRDPLNAALQEAEGKLKAQTEKLRALVAGGETMESLRKQAAELVEGKRLADEYSPNHLKSKRPDANSKEIAELKEKTYQDMLLGEQIKGITFANERNAATSYEADQAMERLANNGAAKQTDAFRALAREMLRAEERLGAGTAGFAKWAAARDTALLGQARADAGNAAVDQKDRNQSARAALLPTEKARLAAELAATAKNEDDKHNVIIKTLNETIQAREESAIKAAVQEGTLTQESLAEINKITADALAVRDAYEAQYTERKRIRREEELRAMESSTQRMTREWKDYGKAIDDIGANASNGFVNMLTSSMSSGKVEVKNFIQGILQDIAAAKLKQTLADSMSTLASAGGDWLKKNVFGMSQDASASAATTARTTADTTAATAAGALAANMELTAFSTQVLGDAMMAAAAQAGGSGAMGFIGSAAAAYFGGSSAGSGGGAPTNELFANGGVMTSMGKMELRKYANGGVANRPQVAIYGEGSMNEAFVPLPDGRSIPVTMQGGGQKQAAAAPAVQVNVINQTNQAVNAQQGSARFDGRAYILDVVMTAASSPGPFRQNMKEAMK